MPRYVALLRGVNVGGRNRLPMADLRAELTAAGLLDVQTYIQSGNVVARHSSRRSADVTALVSAVLRDRFDLDVPVVALTAAALDRVVADNPFPDESDPRRVHVFFLPRRLDAEAGAATTRLVAAAAARGGRDALVVAGPVMYLHTPDGFGRSELAEALSARGAGAHRGGTARNWATVTALQHLAAQAGPLT